MKRLLIILGIILYHCNISIAQNATFIALDNGGNLYEVNVGTCKSKSLNLCSNTTGSPLSIALDGTTLYIVDNKGWLYKNTLGPNGTTGNCKNLGQFISKSNAIYGLTVGVGGIVYAANNSQIETYNPTTAKFAILGSVPSTYSIGGDLLFYKGILYEAVNVGGSTTNNSLLQINLANPSASSVYMNFTPGTKVFGFASVTVPCSNNQAYAVSTSTSTTEIFAVDMTTKQQSANVVCTLPYKVNDAASVAETQSASPPINPTVVSPVNLCQFDPVTALSATVTSIKDTLRWYTTPTGGTSTGKPVPTLSSNTIGTTYYYVSDYDTSTGCESTRDTIIVNVNAYPPVPTINPTGTHNLCAGNALLLTSSSASGNQWLMNGTNIAGASNTTYSANATGSYTVVATAAGGCSKTSVPTLVNVSNASIAYPGSPFCPVGTKAVNFSGDKGGKFSSTTGLVIDSITGTIDLGNSVSGTYTVTYTVGPINCTFTTVVTVTAQSAGISYSKRSYCKSEGNQAVIFAAGSNVSGTFSSSPVGLSLGTNGTITPSASSVGKYLVSYTYGTAGVGCGLMTSTDSVFIEDVPVVPAISGTNKLCTGSSATLTNATIGGIWTSDNSGLATVNSVTGVVNAVAQGNVNITYSVINGCGTTNQVQAINITNGPVMPAITGGNMVCINQSITLSNTTTGGTWTSSDNSVATINTVGFVTGVKVGNATISYSISNSCGIASQTLAITVNAAPTVPVITGVNTICANTTTSFTNTLSGGLWSSNDITIATVNSSGLVKGISNGITAIVYTASNSCGSNAQALGITVNDVPATPTITGNKNLCVSGSASLSTATLGGIWNSNNTAIATVNTTGLVSGLFAGNADITYSLTNTCGTSTSVPYTVTVDDKPIVNNITGNNSVCANASTPLNNTTTGGFWSSSNMLIATVSATGLVNGIAEGQSIINYAVSNICGTTTQSFPININDKPNIQTITGGNTVCTNSTIQLIVNTFSGTWTSSNTAVATVSSFGLVSGILNGNSLITYSETNTCGTSSEQLNISVTNGPSLSPISGNSIVCINSSIPLKDFDKGGIWSSNNTSVATIDNNGNAYGISAGTAIITYSLTNNCGTSKQTHAIAVAPIPSSAFITNPLTPKVCVGDPILFTDNSVGSTVVRSIWYMDDNTIDTNYSLSYIYPNASTYWVTHRIIDQNGCLSNPSNILVTIDSLPVVQIDSLIFVLENNTTILMPTLSGLDGNYSVVWTPSIYLNNPTIINPVCTPEFDTTYTITVRNTIGCKGTGKTKVVVLKSSGIPNVFTPNGDGKHDKWEIDVLKKYPVVNVRIFDRGGQLIFSCSNQYVAWDGKHNGEKVPTGVYYYVIDRGFNLPPLSGSLMVIW